MRAAHSQKGERENEQCVVFQREQKVPMQQRVKRPRRAATGTIQACQLVKQAHGIKTMHARIKEKHNCARAEDRRAQNDSRKNRRRWWRGGFYFRRNGLRFGAHDLLKLIGVDYDLRMTGCQRNQQKQKTGGGKNESGDGNAASFMLFRMIADLHERDYRKNESENIERKSAAATNQRH
jgi:hypothetical protein